MNRGQLEQRPRRRAIQNAERRSLRLRGVLAAVNRQYRYCAGKEASRERLILNRHREVVPTCHTQIGPVINSGRRLRVDEAPNGRGSACRPSRRTDLVADDVYLLLFTHQTQHRQDKVLPFGGVYPRCAQHDSRTTRNHMTLATEFADPVDAQRVSVVGWLVGAFKSTIEQKTVDRCSTLDRAVAAVRTNEAPAVSLTAIAFAASSSARSTAVYAAALTIQSALSFASALVRAPSS